jgi:hypothetical protein
MASEDCIPTSKKRGRYREYLFDSNKMPSKVRREVEVLIADGNGIGQSVTSVASQESDINLLDWVQDAESDSDSSIVGEVEAESCSEVEAPTFSENLTEEVVFCMHAWFIVRTCI